MHEAERKQAVEHILLSTSNEPARIDEIARVRGWFRPRGDSPFNHPLQLYMRGTMTLAQASKGLKELYRENNYALAGNDPWYCIFHHAKKIPYWDADQHDKLADVVIAWTMCALGVTGSDTSQDAYDLTIKWSLGPALREVFNDAPGVGSGFSEPERHAWINLNAFLAHLTNIAEDYMRQSTEKQPDDELARRTRDTLKKDLRSYALICVWTMRDALEEEFTANPDLPTEVAATPKQKMDAWVPAAAVWVIVRNQKLYGMDIDLTATAPNQGNPARAGKLWKDGKPALCAERRAFWKTRFKEFMDLPKDSMDAEARLLSILALQTMESVESGYGDNESHSRRLDDMKFQAMDLECWRKQRGEQ